MVLPLIPCASPAMGVDKVLAWVHAPSVCDYVCVRRGEVRVTQRSLENVLMLSLSICKIFERMPLIVLLFMGRSMRVVSSTRISVLDF